MPFISTLPCPTFIISAVTAEVNIKQFIIRLLPEKLKIKNCRIIFIMPTQTDYENTDYHHHFLFTHHRHLSDLIFICKEIPLFCRTFFWQTVNINSFCSEDLNQAD